MADDSNWAGRGYSRPGPQGEDLSPAREGTETRQGDCPLHMWGGPGHSVPFRDCEGDREREAG
jgi:hypothetical protein